MTLDEYMDVLIKHNSEAEEDCDYETLAFEAGVEYAVKKIKEFLNTETKEHKAITLPEYLDILDTLSDRRKDEDFGDSDISWEESGYQSALYDVKKYMENDEEFINQVLNEYKKLED